MSLPTAVVTGMGIISAIGANKEAFWEALRRGQGGLDRVDLFDASRYRSALGGQVRNGALKDRPVIQGWRHLGRCDLLGLLAAEEAIREARIVERKLPSHRIAVVLGAGCGGLLEAERYRRDLHTNLKKPRPSLLMPFPACTLTDLLGSVYGFLGLRSTIATACSSSATAIGYAADLIKSRKADMVITGGAESLSELTFAGFNSLRSIDRTACRPFDRDREGLVLGEGAGILVIESQDMADAHCVPTYGTVLGYGLCSDACHMTSPDPEGEGAMRSMSMALANAGVGADAVDYINAHGTGTPVNDRIETLAIKKLFGKRAYEIPVSSTKSAHGHCLGAAGAVEAVASLLALRYGMIPPTLNYREPDPDCDLDYVPNQARAASLRLALSNSFAFGGNNTTLVLEKNYRRLDAENTRTVNRGHPFSIGTRRGLTWGL
jgi:3-oxoacyl-[acyl-carrier-protein] synthase II